MNAHAKDAPTAKNPPTTQDAVAAPTGDATERGQRADQLAKEATKLAAEGNLELAREKLREAFQLKPVYDIAGNLGGIELGLKDYRAAAGHLAFSLRVFPGTGSKSQRAQTAKFLAQSLPHVCRFTLRVKPKNAMAKIDGHNLGAGPFEFQRYLNPGQHEVTLSAPGYEPVQQTHQCDAGSESEINGQLIEIVPPPLETPPLWPVAVGGGVALVALGVGIGLMVAAGGEDSDADALLATLREGPPVTDNPCLSPADPTKCSELKSMRENKDQFANIGVGMLVVGGVAALATGGYLAYALTAEDEATTATLKISPTGITLIGSF